MLDYLPNGAVLEILIRLPVKSLVRFRCVCKDWLSLISSNAFIAAHTNQSLSRSDDNNKILFRYGQSVCTALIPSRKFEHFSLRSDDGSFSHNNSFIQLNCPLERAAYFNDFPNMLGSWNGLICLNYYHPSYGYGYTLWNPSIHKAISLPEPNLVSSNSLGKLEHSHGFGYDPSTNDIKLVRLKFLHNKVPEMAEIYTLNTGGWRPIAAPAPSYVVNDRCLSVFVNRASHWVAHTPPGVGTFHNVIVAFDMGDEVFREIAVPNCFVRKLYLNMTVAVRDGLLCLVPFNEREQGKSFSIWVMKEYGIQESWTKLFNIRQGLKRVVGFRKNGEVLVTDRDGELLSYEPNTKLETRLGFCKFSSSETKIGYVESWFYLDKYMESLILLNAKNGVPEGLANTSDSSARRRQGTLC
jgi:F-box interacting protein